MEQVGTGDRTSMVVDDYDDNLHSDSDSDEVNMNPDQFEAFTRHGWVKIVEGSREHEAIKKTFLVGMGPLSRDVEIVAVHKNLGNGLAGQARLQSFIIFEQAVSRKCGGDANVKYAWYGASWEEICRILAYGFSLRSESAVNDVRYGVGIHLCPFLLDSVESSVADENGRRHVLFCRVILGKTEAIPAHSKQFHPRSVEFDSGVDNLVQPRRYILWSAFMNSHIFPSFIISFKPPSIQASINYCVNISFLRDFPVLLSLMPRFLDPPRLDLISKSWADFHTNRISRQQLLQSVRQIAGDRLLGSILSSYRDQFLVRNSGGGSGSRNGR